MLLVLVSQAETLRVSSEQYQCNGYYTSEYISKHVHCAGIHVVVAYNVASTCNLHAWMSGGCNVCEARIEAFAGI
jgi:hypothetical protein